MTEKDVIARVVIPPYSLPPSQYVRLTRNLLFWQPATTCEECGRVGHYDDAHPANPCGRCGGKVVEGAAAVWTVIVSWKWWMPWRQERGFWNLKKVA